MEMIGKIEDSISRVDKEDFMKDKNLQDTTLRRLQVVREKYKEDAFRNKKQHKEINWRKFEKLRNIISHKPASLEYEPIWDFIENNLDELKSGIIKIT